METESTADFAAVPTCLICSFVAASMGAISSNYISTAVSPKIIPFLSYIGLLGLKITFAVLIITYY